MRAVVQRVSESRVAVESNTVSEIGAGLLVLLGVARDDSENDADYLAEKIVNLRVFDDFQGKMNRSLREIDGEMMVVSQFTLCGDCRKGRRPSYVKAASPDAANRLYSYFIDKVIAKGIRVKSGRFRATMAVALINDGPVTLIVDSSV
jgi:D-tyrosyl-tRNA(Tyr) deacylase